MNLLQEVKYTGSEFADEVHRALLCEFKSM